MKTDVVLIETRLGVFNYVDILPVWVVLWACVVDRVVVGVVVVVVPEFKITVNTWCANWNPSDVTQMYCPLFVTSKCVITSVFPSLVMCEFGGRSPVGYI